MPYYENEDFEMKYWDGYSPFAIVEDAGEYLEDEGGDGNPILLFISLATPHFPHHTAPEEYKEMYPPKDLILRENVIEDKYPELRKELQGYYAHCTATDKAIGNLLQRMKDLGLYDNSIILFTSDHGEMMGSHGIRPKEKTVAWDEAIKVPFLIRYPGIGANEGKEAKTPLHTPDILPTMLSLAGIKIPDNIEGEDLSFILRNPEKQKDRAVLFMSVYPLTITPVEAYRGIRTKQYTYVKTTEKATMLFDNFSDPYQLNNLVGKPESRKLQERMDRMLRKELKAIDDENFKSKEYYPAKWGFDFSDGPSIPYNVTPGKITRVVTPNDNQKEF
jgi:arylsulfatase A-like enzyme